MSVMSSGSSVISDGDTSSDRGSVSADSSYGMNGAANGEIRRLRKMWIVSRSEKALFSLIYTITSLNVLFSSYNYIRIIDKILYYLFLSIPPESSQLLSKPTTLIYTGLSYIIAPVTKTSSSPVGSGIGVMVFGYCYIAVLLVAYVLCYYNLEIPSYLCKFLCLTICIMTTYCYIPFINGISVLFICENKVINGTTKIVSSYDYSYDCFEGSHTVTFISSIVFTLSFVGITMLYHYLSYPKIKSGGLIHGRYQALHRFLALLLVIFRGFSIQSVVISAVIRFVICILDFIGCWYYFASQSVRLEGFEIGSCLIGVWSFAIDILRCSKCDDRICFGLLIGGIVICLFIGFQIPKYRLKRIYKKFDPTKVSALAPTVGTNGAPNTNRSSMEQTLSRRSSSRSSFHSKANYVYNRKGEKTVKNLIMLGLRKPFSRVYGPYRLVKYLHQECENKANVDGNSSGGGGGVTSCVYDTNVCRQFLILNIPLFTYDSCFWMYYLCFCEENANEINIINSLKLVSNASSLDMRYYIYQLLIMSQYPKETPSDRIKLIEMNRTLRDARMHHKEVLKSMGDIWESIAEAKSLANHSMLKKFSSLFHEVVENDNKAMNCYRKLMKGHAGNQNVLRSYASYLEHIRSDIMRSNELNNWADEIDKQEAIEFAEEKSSTSPAYRLSLAAAASRSMQMSNVNLNENNMIIHQNGSNRAMNRKLSKRMSSRMSNFIPYNNSYVNNIGGSSNNNKIKPDPSPQTAFSPAIDEAAANTELRNEIKKEKNKTGEKDDIFSSNKTSECDKNGLGIQKLEKVNNWFTIITIFLFCLVGGVSLIFILCTNSEYLEYLPDFSLRPFYMWTTSISTRDLLIDDMKSYIKRNSKIINVDGSKYRKYQLKLSTCQSIIGINNCHFYDMTERIQIPIIKFQSGSVVEKSYLTLNEAGLRYLHSIEYIKKWNETTPVNEVDKKLYKDEYDFIVSNAYTMQDGFSDPIKEIEDNMHELIESVMIFLYIYISLKIIQLIIAYYFYFNAVGLAHMEQHLGLDMLKLLPIEETKRLSSNFQSLLDKFNNPSEQLNLDKDTSEDDFTMSIKNEELKKGKELLNKLEASTYKCSTRKKLLFYIFLIFIKQLIVLIVLTVVITVQKMKEDKSIDSIYFIAMRMNYIEKIHYSVGQMIINKNNNNEYNKYKSLIIEHVRKLEEVHSSVSYSCDYARNKPISERVGSEEFDLYFDTTHGYKNYQSLDSTIDKFIRSSLFLAYSPPYELSFDSEYYKQIEWLRSDSILHNSLEKSMEIESNQLMDTSQNTLIAGIVIFCCDFLMELLAWKFFYPAVLTQSLINDVIIVRIMLKQVKKKILAEKSVIVNYIICTNWCNDRIVKDNIEEYSL